VVKYSPIVIPYSMQIKFFNLNNTFILVIYTQNLKIIINTNSRKLNFNIYTYSIYYKTQDWRSNFLIKKFRRIFLFLFFLICWKKFKIHYNGKGYRLRKYINLNFIDFIFGACHFIKTSIPGYKLKFKRKKSIIVYYKFPFRITNDFNKVTNIRANNLYTQRGLKNSRQLIYRKPKNKLAYI
jgi:hypothetical protein